jgi:hypothetical protein
MKRLLVQRFGFTDDEIVTLVEDLGREKTRPTRANIEREFQELARTAQRGDHIVILLSGHGSQEPDQAPLDERDGLDEVFLPADIEKWDARTARVKNAIRDDDLGVWLGAIRARGASVWLIVDACHSGSMIRGNDVEVARQLAPQDDLGIPEDALDRARAASRGLPADRSEDAPAGRAERVGGIVAIYAAQPEEVTPELPLPRDQAGTRWQGLLTYTLGTVLSQAVTPLSYRQLVQRIHTQYAAWDRISPTPLIEGEDQDHAVLDEGILPDRPSILLSRDGEDWMINAGALHGLTAGSILAVYPAAGQDRPGGQPLGHVRVTRTGLGTFDAEVEPWDHAAGRRVYNKVFPDGAQCRPVFIDFGSLRIKVAIDTIVGKDVPAGIAQTERLPVDRRERLSNALKESVQEEGTLFEVVDDPRQAEWLVRAVAADRDEVYLVPGAGWSRRGGEGDLPPLFGPLAADRAVWNQRLNQIAKVQNLLKIVGGFGSAPALGSSRLRLDVELRRYASRADQVGTPIVWGPRGIELHAGEIVGGRVTNPSRETVEVTLLFINSGYGVQVRFPRSASDDNVLKPHQSIDLPRYKVTSETVGLEWLVAIAVKSLPQTDPVDFTFLTEETIDRARGVAQQRGGEDRTIDSPLGQLLQNAAFAAGKSRGLSLRSLDDYTLDMIPWTTLAEERPGTAR